MKKPAVSHEQAQMRYASYVVGFVLSVLTTLAAFLFVMNGLLPKDTLVYVVLGIAALQLTVQMVFFLHLGQGSRWKALTFWFTLLLLLIIVIGTIWIMHNLDYNMMHMTPDQMQQYMNENEGI